MSNIDDPMKEERREIEELARNAPTDSICRGWAFDKRSPLGTSTPKQLTTSTPEEAASVEMRKPDARTYSSSRDIRTTVAARSVSSARVVVDQHEDPSSSDESLSSDVPSETESDEAQARSRDYTNLRASRLTNTRRSVVVHTALLPQNCLHLQVPLELGNRLRSNLNISPACTSGENGLVGSSWNSLKEMRGGDMALT